MSPLGEALVAANRLKMVLDELATARQNGLRIGRAQLLMLERVIEQCAMHEAGAGL